MRHLLSLLHGPRLSSGLALQGRTRILFALLAAIGISAILFAAYWFGIANNYERNSMEGFPLNGMYVSAHASRPSAAFLESDNDDLSGVYQVINKDDLVLEGTYAQTFDPNVYTLFDQEGNTVGSAHLAFASREGTNGLLFLQLNDSEVVLRKTNRAPAFLKDRS